ncbi:hypothetical protein TruAng_011968 [Truncatella angustata]|nr:hypothetical protein TruAng_011968 [Truncatella angustata]
MSKDDPEASRQVASRVCSVVGEKHAVEETNTALNNERKMGVIQSLLFWRKAVAFSFFISLAVIMEGYDTSLMNNFFPFPAFKNKFGDEIDPDGGMLVSSKWQTIILNGTQIGCIIGLVINGYISEWLGYKKTMVVTMFAMVAAVFIPFFSTSLGMYLAGGIIQGLPWGVFQTLAVSYAAEWGYRIPFALQWLWPIPITVATLLCPESPWVLRLQKWWLVRKGRINEARTAIRQLTSPMPGIDFDVDAHVGMMVTTDQFERQAQSGTNYWHCFQGSDRRRTEISAMVCITQAFCGVPFMAYGVQFMERAGLGTNAAFDLNVVQSCVGFIGCIIAWWAMTYFGRRLLYLAGLSSMLVILIIIGFLGLAAEANSGMSLGPTCYTIFAEIPSTQLRIKTVVLARASYNSAVFINNAIMPKIVGKNDWNWGAKGGFFWAGIDLLFLVWTWFRLPESKGLTYTWLVSALL